MVPNRDYILTLDALLGNKCLYVFFWSGQKDEEATINSISISQLSGISKENVRTIPSETEKNGMNTSSQDNDKQTNTNINNQSTRSDSVTTALEDLSTLKLSTENDGTILTEREQDCRSLPSSNKNNLQTSDFPVMNSLSVAQMTPYDNLPCSKVLLSGNMMGQGNQMEHDFHLTGSDKLRSVDDEDELGRSIACRLSKRLGIEVFVSCSIPSTLDIIKVIASLEKKLIRRIQKVDQ